MADEKRGEIRVIRAVAKKKARGRSGGSWKVAYADFMTAMMAFFLVLWIIGLDPATKELIESYFSDPIGFQKGHVAGTSPVSAASMPAPLIGPQITRMIREYQQSRFEEVAEQIRDRLSGADGLQGIESYVEIVVTDDGLRIELIEPGDGDMFFAVGSAKPTPIAREVLRIIGAELGKLTNTIVLEGHTDAIPFSRPDYSNWELSVDRANAARALLEWAGIDKGRIVGVRGYADRKLRKPDDPFNPANRRVSILLPFATVEDTRHGATTTAD